MANTHRTLDRLVQFDERSRNFPVTAVVPTEVLVSNTWDCNTWNDQGQEGACVGFGFSHELSATPDAVPTNYTIAMSIYNRAKVLDQWPGTDYSGTSVLAGAKAVTELKNNVGESYIGSYRWAFGLRDLVLAVGHVAPVVIGVNWYEGMFEPDANNYIHKSGALSGGHCTLILGVVVVLLDGVTEPTTLAQIDLDKSYAIIHNSWGKSWGVNGRCKISFRDLSGLLDEQGEACVPLAMTVDQEVVTPSKPDPAPAPKPTPGKVGGYFSVRGSTVFHRGHPGLRSNRVFPTFAAARKAGYRPCGVCRPTP